MLSRADRSPFGSLSGCVTEITTHGDAQVPGGQQFMRWNGVGAFRARGAPETAGGGPGNNVLPDRCWDVAISLTTALETTELAIAAQVTTPSAEAAQVIRRRRRGRGRRR